MTKAIENLLNKFKHRFGDFPQLVQFDDGKEFDKVGVKT